MEPRAEVELDAVTADGPRPWQLTDTISGDRQIGIWDATTSRSSPTSAALRAERVSLSCEITESHCVLHLSLRKLVKSAGHTYPIRSGRRLVGHFLPDRGH